VEFIAAKVRQLQKHRAPTKIFLNPDCGFGTFADRPVNTSEVAAQKLNRIAAAAQQLRAERT
jgi:5-methyltetrahydropteroyltriglutamate--homocysteine methyltransferase